MGVNLHKMYSAVNSSLTKLFDNLGVQRTFTIPYVDGQDMSEHVQTVGKAAGAHGGLAKNFVTTSHHSDGKGWGTGDGHTVGHPTHSLRSTVIPKDDADAKAAIQATQKYLKAIGSLLGDNDPSVETAMNKLALVKKTDAAGMNLFDFGTLLIQILHAPTQAVARAHHMKKPQGGTTSKLLPPHTGEQQPAPEEPQAPNAAPAAAAPAQVPPAAPPQVNPAAGVQGA